MKRTIWISTFALSCILPSLFALPINDEFNDTEIDSSVWQVRLPFGDSTAVESDGHATIRNGAQLITKNVFSTPYQIEGRIKMAGNSRDTLVLNFRTDGLSDPAVSPNELINSVQIRFTKFTDPGAEVNLIYAQDWNDAENRGNFLGQAIFDFEIGDSYTFKFQDDGLNFDFFLGDLSNPLLSGTSSQPNGGKFGIINRPGIGGGSSISEGSIVEIDYVRVQSLASVPDKLPVWINGALFALFAFRSGRKATF